MHWFGGGHADYWGYDVWEFDLETRAPFTKDRDSIIVRDTTAAEMATYVDNVNYPGAVVIGGVPLYPQSRHTGSSQCWIPSLGKFFVEGSSTYSGNSAIGIYLWIQNGGPCPMDAKDRWLYSPATDAWEYEGSDYNTTQINRLRGGTVYHHNRDLLYAVGSSGSSLVIESWNPHTKAVTTVSTRVVGTTSSVVGTLDDANDCIYAMSFSTTTANPMRLHRYDIAANSWSEITLSGTVPNSYSAAYQNAVFSTRTGRILLLYNSTLGMYSINPVAGDCVQSSISPTLVNGCFNNFKFCRRRRVAFFTHSTQGGQCRIWAYKEAS